MKNPIKILKFIIKKPENPLPPHIVPTYNIGKKISKEEVCWHNEDEYIVMKEDGWRIIFVVNHFKNKSHYEIQTPEGYYLPVFYHDIYKAIERINEERNQVK